MGPDIVYYVELRSEFDSDSWFRLRICSTLEEARKIKEDEIKNWNTKEDYLRIVKRTTYMEVFK